MKIWLIIFGMGIVTYGVRLLPLTSINEEALPDWVRRGLNYVPIAVLSAIIGPSYLPSQEWFQFTVDAHLIAGTAAMVVAWFTRSTVLTIITGVVLLLLLS